MREIKFRAWDGTKMWSDGSSSIHGILRDSIDGGIIVPTSEITLMQFTGLYDKNGKEIYEGDILDWNSGKGQSSVVWLDGGCWGTSQGNPLGAAAKMSEVIGNIYENSDLLK